MKKSLTVIVPAYNEDTINLKVIRSACKNARIKCIIVDDGSDYPIGGADIRWSKNKGCGAAVKAGIRKANTTHVAVIDADAQYDIIDLVEMWQSMEDEDQLIGKRVTHQGVWRRWAGRLFLKTIASIIALRYIPDLNTGVRIMKRKIALAYESLICNEFSYCSSYTLCFLLDGYHVNWLPIGFYPRRGTKSTVKMVRHGLIALHQILRLGIALRTRRIREYLRKRG